MCNTLYFIMSSNNEDHGVNQQRIADLLGVSRTTVSRCFTNHPGISPITRARVFDLASQMGYQHMEMRSPAKAHSKKTGRVGVLVCTEIEEYLRQDYESPGVQIYAGICEYSQLHKLNIELRYVNPLHLTLDDPSYSQIEPLRQRSWDGVILIYPFPRNVVDELNAVFPMVSMVEQYGTSSINCVDVDHFKGIALLFNQLTALGHERIGFYTKAYNVEPGWSFRRFSAYVEKNARLQRALDPQDVINIHPNTYSTLDEGFDAAAARVRDGVTAWVCAADHQAYDLIVALKKRGIRVPEDVSVTGFDGIKKPKGALQLTTAAIPYREIGYTGAKRLRDIMQKRFGSPQHTLIGCQIRKGDTIGAPPASHGATGRSNGLARPNGDAKPRAPRKAAPDRLAGAVSSVSAS
jgi:DNA-binding LacI/PurR family transcriptional regulator